MNMPKRKLETLETGEGNTKPPLKRMVPSKKWCFTYNNYPEDAVETLETIFSSLKCEYIFGEEVGENGTPHLQGYVEAPHKIRPIEKFQLDKGIHWEKARGDRSENIKYCAKDGKCVYSRELKPAKPLKLLNDEQLYDWQLEILEQIKEEPDDRTVHWYWSMEGNVGKTSFSKYLVAKHGATLIAGKANDVKNGIVTYVKENGGRTPELVVFPIPMSFDTMSYNMYEAIENIKDMFFYSGKYEGGSVCGNCPHVYIFANMPPDTTRLASDRWNIVNIDEPLET